MKSQSTITGRVLPESASNFYKEVSYWVRYNKTWLGAIATVLVFGTVVLLVGLVVNNTNNQKAIRYAKLYHYTVGSKQSCNLDGDQDVENRGWVPCTITAVSKDNRYYTATFDGGGGDKHHDTNAIYTFENQYIGKP